MKDGISRKFPKRKLPVGPGGYGSPLLFLSEPNKPYKMGIAERVANKVRACHPGERVSNMVNATWDEH